MEPYIVAAVNAQQALNTGAADYIAREKARRTRNALLIIAGALAVAIYLKKSR